ncbi:hypothetical protein [Gordonia rubripertincta]|uniref:DNA topoisomerase (ATP-hydrolyzing) n=1 Tax=Gordonia rubripertincta TaxID=36822 RepID=A0ABT4MXW1_GORRU|nr:hypothetical protein [Gordonia rubripertincta]MCZ4551837.1 hypothetical protein [Gordonia rubripertincta]
MRTPTWAELVGRNVAASALSLSGSLRVSGKNRQGEPFDERFEFWHGGGGQWRIERNGTVVYLASADGTVTVLVDGEMRRQPSGHIRMAWVGSMFSPLDLLGEESLLRKMSTRMRASREAEAIENDGRATWSTELVTPKGDDTIELAFDDATGILVLLRSPNGGLLQVTNLAVHDQIESELFTWDGTVVAAESGRNDPRAQAANRIETLSALVSALERPQELLSAVAGTDDHQQARTAVIDLLGVSDTGADAVLSMQVRRFGSAEVDKIRRELAELRQYTEHPSVDQ